MDPAEVRANAQEIADEAIAAFSQMHPHITMNLSQWEDLKETISREVRGHFETNETGKLVNLKALDLLALD